MNRAYRAATMQALRKALSDLRIDELEIEAIGSVLYLHGVAPCYRAKRRATQCAEAAMPGVEVQNEVRVAEQAYVDDAEVARGVIRQIAALGEDVLGRVSVDVRGAVVSLYGWVRDPRERRSLLGAAAGAACVRGIEDHLMLKDQEPADTEVSQALALYVQRAMNLPPGIVTVTCRSGVASLTGSVRTETQRRAIEELVLWHDHVNDVVNQLRIVPSFNARMTPPRAHPGASLR